MSLFVLGAVAQHPAGRLADVGVLGSVSEPMLFVMLGVFLLFAVAVLRKREAVQGRMVASSVRGAKTVESVRTAHVHSVNSVVRPHVATLTPEAAEISG